MIHAFLDCLAQDAAYTLTSIYTCSLEVLGAPFGTLIVFSLRIVVLW